MKKILVLGLTVLLALCVYGVVTASLLTPGTEVIPVAFADGHESPSPPPVGPTQGDPGGSSGGG